MHRHLYHLAEESSLHNIFPFLRQYPKYNKAKSNFPLGKLQNAQKKHSSVKMLRGLGKTCTFDISFFASSYPTGHSSNI